MLLVLLSRGTLLRSERTPMLKNHLVVALRNLRRHKLYAAITIFGLALGLACCLLIFLFVHDELSVDAFHARADRLYRLNKIVTPQEGAAELHATSSGLMGPTLVADFPEVEQAVRFLPWFDDVLLTHGQTTLKLPDVAFADANFFAVFDFGLKRGHSATVLEAPFSIVLTETTARRLFGDADPVGQTLTALADQAYTVTGIAEDPPLGSHMTYNALISWSTTVPDRGGLEYAWLNNWLTQVLYTYLLLAPGTDVEALEAKLPAFMQRHFAERAQQYALYLQPFEDLYLGSAGLLYTDRLRQGNRTYVYVFSAIAVLILLMACINFMNLATARAVRRAVEVGVRKAVGARRRQLVVQFLGESFLMTGLALVVAAVLVETVRPAFNAFTGKHVAFDVLGEPWVLASLLALVLLVGFGAGLYPALVLSGFQPVRVLKGTAGVAGGLTLRRVLVTAQFTISIVLLAGTVVVYRQMQFMQGKNLGFEGEQVVVLALDGTAMQGASFEAFKQELLRHPNISRAAGSSPVPGQGMMGFEIKPEGRPEEETWTAWALRLDDDDLLATYGMELVAGRYFSEDRSTDTSAVVINETLAQTLGWDSPVGKRLDVVGELDGGTVIGVVKDFHYESLHHAIDPLVLFIAPRHRNLSLRVSGEDLPGTLAYLRETWQRFEQRYPFEYEFLDAAFAQLYGREQRLLQTLGLFAGLAIVVACLGLFGLAAFTAEQRTKEIGIRKVLGASVPGLVTLLSKDFLRLVLLGFVLACPTAYLAMHRWLENFAYRVDPGPGVFVLAGGMALVMALLAVSYQAVKAARADPVKSLRYE